MRQPRIYPISFSVSISRVWRVYRGLKTCFSSRGVVSAPQSPNCSFAMPPHFVFSLQQERQSNEVNYSLDVKKRLLVKKKKKKNKGMQLHQRSHTTVLSTWDTIFYSVSKNFKENEEFLLYRRGMKHPLRKRVTTFVPASQRNTITEGKLCYHWSK